jgi:hypothetical protein
MRSNADSPTLHLAPHRREIGLVVAMTIVVALLVLVNTSVRANVAPCMTYGVIEQPYDFHATPELALLAFGREAARLGTDDMGDVALRYQAISLQALPAISTERSGEQVNFETKTDGVLTGRFTVASFEGDGWAVDSLLVALPPRFCEPRSNEE